jgi:flavin-dependent dehydrogenase
MARYQYDITIIGGGSGGLTAARLAYSLGARTCLIDK